MKKFRSIILLFIILQSCQKEFRTTNLDSIVSLQTSTEKWLITKKDSIDFIQSATIDTILLKLNWDLVQIKQISGNKEMAYIPFNSEANKGVTIVYNKNDFSIDTANLIAAEMTNNSNFNGGVINIYSKTFNVNFTGVLSIFSIDNKFNSKIGIIKGRKLFSSEIRKKRKGQSERIKAASINPSTKNCIEHFLVTTYEDGFEIWEYLYTTCSSDCEITSKIELATSPKIKTNCIGNESGGGTGGDAVGAQYDTELLSIEIEYRNHMSVEEKKIFDNEMNTSQKVKYLINGKTAKTLSELFFESNTLSNGKGDAFRHALFIALNAKALGPELASRLASAHEVNNNIYVISEQMDLKNNQIGLNLYYSLNAIPNDYISYFTVLQIELMSKINNGDLWIISNLDSNSNLTPFSTLIRSNE